jgi:hypothetical protein
VHGVGEEVVNAVGAWATRRRFLGVAAAAPWLAGCGTPLPLTDSARAAGGGNADELLRLSAEAHGLAAYRGMRDINVRYEGQWRPLIGRVQPVLVDMGYRGASKERVLPVAGLVAHTRQHGPLGNRATERGPE